MFWRKLHFQYLGYHPSINVLYEIVEEQELTVKDVMAACIARSSAVQMYCIKKYNIVMLLYVPREN